MLAAVSLAVRRAAGGLAHPTAAAVACVQRARLSTAVDDGVDTDVWMWGAGRAGEQGNGATADVAEPMRVAALTGARVRKVVCGARHVVALDASGHVHAWGCNANGQLGAGTFVDAAEPRRIVVGDDDARVCDVAAGSSHTVFLTESGDVYVSGSDVYGQVGRGARKERPENTHTRHQLVPDMDAHMVHTPTRVGMGGDKATKVFSGDSHVFALTKDANVWAWGAGGSMQLGTGVSRDEMSPFLATRVGALKPVALAAGLRHSGALLEDGSVFMWGGGYACATGMGHDNVLESPELVPFLEGRTIAALACGDDHTAVLTTGGQVFTWGSGESGQLGHGDDYTSAVARPVNALMGKRVSHVACGGDSTFARTRSGLLYAWGSNDHHALGLGTSAPPQVERPALVEALVDHCVLDVASGAAHTIALTAAAP